MLEKTIFVLSTSYTTNVTVNYCVNLLSVARSNGSKDSIRYLSRFNFTTNKYDVQLLVYFKISTTELIKEEKDMYI